MSIYVHIVFDFDAAIGQINASYPYNFKMDPIFEEIENMRALLEIARDYKVKFSVAITGFTAEEGVYPFNLPSFIREIYKEGHEIASHTWKHEWVPFLEKDQIYKSFKRSKLALEKCIGEKGAIVGLVLPHNRPMSWYAKGAFSLGDRAIFPLYKGADIGSVLKIAENCGYSWVRVSYQSIYEKILKTNKRLGVRSNWYKKGKVIAVPLNYTGFDSKAIEVVKRGVALRKDVVLCGHPLMLSRKGKTESKENLIKLLDFLAKLDKKIKVRPINCNPNLMEMLSE